MTSPNGTIPQGAWIVGDRMGQDITEESGYAMMRGQTLAGFEQGQDAWKGLESDVSTLSDEVRDGQLDLNNRVDLLDGVHGYCNLFMSANWQLAYNTWITLPFDTQLGPKKGTTLYENGIRLATKGLWRADTHVSFYPGGGTFAAAVKVQVVGITSGTVFTEHRYDIVITSSGAETAAFSHTFVVPSDDQYYVRTVAAHVRSGNARHGVYGGTLRSSLSVNKWDNRTDFNVVLADAPDGGDLG